MFTIMKQRRLHLTAMHHNKQSFLHWKPECPQRSGRPNTTLQYIIQKDNIRSGASLVTTMTTYDRWKEVIILRRYVDDKNT